MSSSDDEQKISRESEQLRQAIARAGLASAWFLPLGTWIHRWRGLEYAIEYDEYMPFAATLALLASYDPQNPPSDLAFVHDLVGLDYAYWQARDRETGTQWSPLEEPFDRFRNRHLDTVVVWQSDAQYPSASALEGLLHTFRRTPLKLS
jgi:hypothetical protein